MTVGGPPSRRGSRVAVTLGALIAVSAACSSAPAPPPNRTAAVRHSSATPPSQPPATTVPSTPPASPAPAVTTAPPTSLATTTTPPPAAAPPYPVASAVLSLVDPSRPTVNQGRVVATSRALTTLVWAPAEPGRWPLVVFGAGFQVSPQPYASLLAAWASHGYVVAAPEFPLADPDVAGGNLDEGDLPNEPGDLRFVIDSLVSPGNPWAQRIDPRRVAAAGHSDGAEAAVAVSVDPVPPGAPAIRALIAMSGQALLAASPLPSPPALVTQGDADTINPYSFGQGLYAQLGTPKFFLDLLGAGHLPPLEAGSPWLPTVEAVTEDFLDLYVAGDGSLAALARDGDRPSLSSLQSQTPG